MLLAHAALLHAHLLALELTAGRRIQRLGMHAVDREREGGQRRRDQQPWHQASCMYSCGRWNANKWPGPGTADAGSIGPH